MRLRKARAKPQRRADPRTAMAVTGRLRLKADSTVRRRAPTGPSGSLRQTAPAVPVPTVTDVTPLEVPPEVTAAFGDVKVDTSNPERFTPRNTLGSSVLHDSDDSDGAFSSEDAERIMATLPSTPSF